MLGDTVINNYQEYGKTWKKSSQDLRFKTSKKNLILNAEGKEEAQNRWKNDKNDFSNKNSSSTLSLHIAAYENSIDARNETENLQKKFKVFRPVESFSLSQQDLFEFPRQQESIESKKPEIQQFKASQKLLSPNQGSHPYLLQRQLSNGIKQPMNTVEACTIIDNTINSLSRSLNMIAEKNNRPKVSSDSQATPAQPQQDQPLPATTSESAATAEPSENSSIVIEAYKDETQMPGIMSVITKELSEPYSIYTYRFFIHNWPELCLLARDTTNNCNIGVIVCKLDHDPKWRRGYIAMLAVEQAYRRRGIGKMLVQRSIEVMREKGCDEVMLEAEVTNKSALILYDRLGFIRERRLYRYYLNGSDAFRLKLLFADCWPEERPLLRDLECDHDQCDHDHQHSHQNQQHRIAEVA